MKNEKVKKINLIYLLSYIFVPIIIIALGIWLSSEFFPKGNMAVILCMAPSIISFIWWVFGGNFIYKHNQKKLEKQLNENGFERNHTFYGRSNMVIVDVVNGKIALLFFWNPFQNFIIPASRINRTWVDDGRGGAGFLEGSSRVSFLFNVDNVKVRVNTFTSNRRWRMDSDYILTGISKADMMVKVLEDARTRGAK
ncbi:MAG: hypothetical protein HFJ45_03775 [Clostridia bacterium]|nr:hypothetical protein [Clostridia bacterium]